MQLHDLGLGLAVRGKSHEKGKHVRSGASFLMAAGPYGSITANSVYRVLSAVVPLYVAVTAGYLAVKFRLLSAADIAGINRFVVLFAIPVLSFRFIAGINLYEISYRLIVADTVFKLLVFGALALYGLVRREAALGWMITLWMVTTLSNTLIVGVPTLVAMYGPLANDLIGQVIVGQAVIWYPGLMLLYEVMASQKEERSQAIKGSLEVGVEPETQIELDSTGSQPCKRDPTRTSGTSSDEAVNAVSYGKTEGTEMSETNPSRPPMYRGPRKCSENGIESSNQENARVVLQVQLGGAPRDNMLYQPEAALSQQPTSPPSEGPSRSNSKLELQHLTSFKNLPELDNSVHKKEQISLAVPKASPVLRGQLSLVVRNQPGLHREASRAEQVERWKRTLNILGWKLRKSFTVHAALLGLVYSLVAYK
jgi:predicted permease